MLCPDPLHSSWVTSRLKLPRCLKTRLEMSFRVLGMDAQSVAVPSGMHVIWSLMASITDIANRSSTLATSFSRAW